MAGPFPPLAFTVIFISSSGFALTGPIIATAEFESTALAVFMTSCFLASVSSA